MQGNVNIPDSTITTNLSFRQLVLMNMQQLTNFPYIENDFDALTDYELLCLVVKYLNDVIANQNEQNDSITRMYESFLELQTYVNNTKDTLEDAFNELDDYVRNYFDNLDVQEEINNKLDQMLEDGVLETIIEQFLQTNAIWSYDNIADMKLATNLINGSYTKTAGYYSVDDGGSAYYRVRTKTVDDVVNEGSIVSLYDETLVAELMPNGVVNPVMFGAYGDGETNDYNAFKNCFDYANLNKCDIKLPRKSYVISGNRLTLKTNLDGNGATIISNDNASGISLDEPLIHVVSDNEFSSTAIPNAYIFRTYSEHANIWKRSGNTAEAALGIVPVEANVQIKNTLLYDYFFDFSNPTTEYRKLDTDTTIKNLVIDKTIVNSERTSYIKRNILIERDNVLLENVVFDLTDNATNTAPYLGLVKLNKCYNVRLNNCVIPAQLTNSSYAFHTSYDVKTTVENCYMNGEYDCWGATSSKGSVDMTYSNCNTNRIDAHEGFFGLTVKDCELSKEGITLTGGKYCDVIRCHFSGRRCVALREDYGSGFNGTIRIKDCDGTITNNEIIYMNSTVDFDYGYDWKSPSIIIEDCNFNETDSIITILNYNVNSNTHLTWFSSTNTIKITNVTSNRNLRIFNVLPHIFGDCDIKLENLNIRSGIYNSFVASATGYTVFVNANKCVVRYPKGSSLVRINGFYTNCEFLDLEFIHLNSTLCGCNLRERDSIAMGYTDSGKHLSMVNMGLLVKESEITTWHENCYNYKAE